MTEIQLKIDSEVLRAIYYKDGNQRYFFGPETKNQSTFFLIALVIFPFFAVYTINLENDWLFTLGCIFLILIFFNFWEVAKPILKWKKSVEEFLLKTNHLKDVKLQYNETFFLHTQDEEVLKQEWTVIERAIINEDCVWLYSNTTLLLPKNSMQNDEFELLSKMILEKVKNVSKS